MNKLDDIYINALKAEVECISTIVPKSPTDFNRLSVAVSAGGKDSLAVSTLKRIWGYVPSRHTPTFTTLSVLARYCGYRDWDAFVLQCDRNTDSDFNNECIITAADEEIGTKLRVDLNDDKWCEIEKIAEPGRFKVTDSMNMKLHKGDEITVNTIAKGDMFVATDCMRNTVSLGTYAGARREGIAAVHRLH